MFLNYVHDHLSMHVFIISFIKRCTFTYCCRQAQCIAPVALQHEHVLLLRLFAHRHDSLMRPRGLCWLFKRPTKRSPLCVCVCVRLARYSVTMQAFEENVNRGRCFVTLAGTRCDKNVHLFYHCNYEKKKMNSSNNTTLSFKGLIAFILFLRIT